MGCHSSSIKFRDVYVQLQNTLNVDQQTRSNTASGESISKRSKVFNTMNQPPMHINEQNVAHDALNRLVFTEAQTEVTFTCLLKFVERTWKLRKLHPLCNYLCIRAAEFIRVFRRDSCVSRPCTLARWNFRLWLVFVCEFFHTLAIFQEMRAIPKAISKWLHKINEKTTIINWNHTCKNTDECSHLLEEQFLSRFYSFVVDHKILGKDLLRQLEAEVPFSTCVYETLGGTVELTRANVVSAVEKFFRISLDLCTFPRPVCNVRVKGIPFMALVEWVTLRHVLSIVGSVEDFPIYCITTREIQKPESPLTNGGREIAEDLMAWRALLHRLYSVIAQFRDGSASPRGEILAVVEEREYLFNKLRSFFERIRSALPSLSPKSICDTCFNLFALIDTFPNRSIHDEMSYCAFRVALSDFDYDIHDARINTFACFCRYLEAYIAIYDLYEVIIEVEERSMGCDVSSMNFVDFANVIKCLQQRQDLSFMLASLISEFDAKELFYLLAKGDDSAEGVRKVSFLDLCVFMAKQRFGFFRPLSELKGSLGIGELDSDKCTTITNYILLKAQSYAKPLEPDFQYCVKATIGLPLYLYSARTATSEAVHFAILAGVYQYRHTIPKEERFSKWKYLLEQSVHNNETFPTRLMIYALYVSVVLLRCFEKTKESHSKLDISLPIVLEKTDTIELLDLHEGINASAEILGLSVEELTRDAMVILTARDHLLSGMLHSEVEKESPRMIITDKAIDCQSVRNVVMLSPEIISQEVAVVGVSDLVYVCLFNYCRHYFSSEPSLQDFLLHPFRGRWDEPLQMLLKSFPFDDEAGLYRQFYKFSAIHQSVCFEAPEDFNRFVCSLYEHYSTFLERLHLSKEDFVSWCLAAPRFIFTDANKTSISARDFRSFLRFLSGCVISRVAYSVEEQFLHSSEHVPVSENLINYLLRLNGDGCEVTSAELEGGRSEIVNIHEILSDLKRKDERGDVNSRDLESVTFWYAKRLVNTLEESSITHWLSIASSLPYRSSPEDEKARFEILQKLRTTGTTWDNYLPISLFARLLTDEYQIDELELPQIPELDNGAENFTAWVMHCTKIINSLTGETRDSSGAKLHESNLRFLLQYIHHSLLTSYVCKEVKKEIDASNFIKCQDDQFDFIEKNVYENNFFQQTFRQFLNKLGASQSCTAKLEERLLNDISATVDVTYVAHLTALTLVADAYSIYNNSNQESTEINKVDNALAGKMCRCEIKNPLRLEQSDHWRRLRDLLPFGVSLRRRAHQAELFAELDQQNKGCLSFDDLYRGFTVRLHLQDYCSNAKSILLRAFFAALEVSEMEQRTIGVNPNQELYITPYEFCAFLFYIYRYMELYFMFDVLTCIPVSVGSNTVDAGASLSTDNNSPNLPRLVHAKKSIAEEVEIESRDSPHNAVAQQVETIILLSTVAPFEATQRAIPMQKKILASQFVMSEALLHSWGLNSENLDDVFRTIDHHSREKGFVYFTSFAIWASEVGLSPDRYEHGFKEINEFTQLIDSL